jgi:antitoxin component YwqK of YwqJK toxin-antitoxin module
MIDYYTNNNRTESQIDTNTDRIFDVFRFYENGKLVREAIDFNYDQTIDSTFTYDAEGNKKREETP